MIGKSTKLTSVYFFFFYHSILHISYSYTLYHKQVEYTTNCSEGVMKDEGCTSMEGQQ